MSKSFGRSFGLLSMHVAAGLAAALLVGGCTQQKAEPAPAPVETKPAPAKAEAKPAPAPMAANNGVQYFPTGRRESSAIAVEKIAPAEVSVAQKFDYTLRVTNLTGGALENVVVTDTIDAGFKMASSNPQGTYDQRTRQLAVSLGKLNAGETRNVTITGEAAGTGSLVNCATVVYSLPLCVTTKVVQPALAITKTAPAEVLLCENIPVKIVVTNNGTGPATNVSVSDPFPAGLTTLDGKGSFEQKVDMLAAGASREFNVVLKANKAGKFDNVANATADGNLKASSATTSTVVRQPVLTIKATCGGTILIGRNTTTKFEVCNTGDGRAANAVVTAPVPAGAKFVSADNGGVLQGNTVVWNLGTLNGKDCKTLSMTVQSTGAGQLAFSANAKADCATAVDANCTTGVQGVPDIGTLVTDGDGVVLVGDNHTYTCEVKNQGQVDLTDVRMTITLPEGLTFVSAGGIANPTVAGNKLTFNVGTVGVGKTVAFTFVGKASKSGELLVIGETTAKEIKTPVRDDELTVFVDR